MNRGYRLGSHKFSHPEIVRLIEECNIMSRAPTSLYESLETLSVKMGLIKVSALGAGSGMKKIARQLAETSVIFEDVMMGIIRQLYAQAVTLTATIIGTTACEGRKERSLDRLDSIHQKTLRLVWLREGLQKKIKKLNKDCFTTISTFGYIKKEAILLHNTPRPQIYFIRNNWPAPRLSTDHSG